MIKAAGVQEANTIGPTETGRYGHSENDHSFGRHILVAQKVHHAFQLDSCLVLADTTSLVL